MTAGTEPPPKPKVVVIAVLKIRQAARRRGIEFVAQVSLRPELVGAVGVFGRVAVEGDDVGDQDGAGGEEVVAIGERGRGGGVGDPDGGDGGPALEFFDVGAEVREAFFVTEGGEAGGADGGIDF